MHALKIVAFSALTTLAACGGQQQHDTKTANATEEESFDIRKMSQETVEECMQRNNPGASLEEMYLEICEEAIASEERIANGEITYIDKDGNERDGADVVNEMVEKYK